MHPGHSLSGSTSGLVPFSSAHNDPRPDRGADDHALNMTPRLRCPCSQFYTYRLTPPSLSRGLGQSYYPYRSSDVSSGIPEWTRHALPVVKRSLVSFIIGQIHRYICKSWKVWWSGCPLCKCL